MLFSNMLNACSQIIYRIIISISFPEGNACDPKLDQYVIFRERCLRSSLVGVNIILFWHAAIFH